MGSRLVFMLLVSGLMSFQGVFPLSARPVFDITGISSGSSERNSEVGDGYQHNPKSTGPCEGGAYRTFAAQLTSSKSSQARRVVVDSSCLRGRQLSDDSEGSIAGPNPASVTDPPEAPTD